MKYLLILLSFFLTFPGDAMAEVEKRLEKDEEVLAKEIDPNLEKAVDEALQAVKRAFPQVHEDALRAWEKFSPASRPVNFTYRFWGRRIILWLKENKEIAFESEQQVGEVFKILWRKKLISEHAVFVLMADAWSHLIYLEGVPSWEKRAENRNPGGGTMSNRPSKGKREERAI